jgi:predicted nucleic acid-binding protein
MRYILDSCVALKWILKEIDTDKALQLRDDFRNGIHELLAPDIFPVEVVHSITRAERQGRISQAEGLSSFQDIIALLPDLRSHLPLLPRAYSTSSAIRIGVYDCLYVALAEREGCELVTSDEKLIKNLQAEFPFIVLLSTL